MYKPLIFICVFRWQVAAHCECGQAMPSCGEICRASVSCCDQFQGTGCPSATACCQNAEMLPLRYACKRRDALLGWGCCICCNPRLNIQDGLYLQVAEVSLHAAIGEDAALAAHRMPKCPGGQQALAMAHAPGPALKAEAVQPVHGLPTCTAGNLSEKRGRWQLGAKYPGAKPPLEVVPASVLLGLMHGLACPPPRCCIAYLHLL